MNAKQSQLIEIFNAFKPEALRDDDLLRYYQSTAMGRGDYELEQHDTLFNRIVHSPSTARLLIVGHLGCGKSTELHMLVNKLSNELDNYQPIIIETKERLNPGSFTYIDLLILIVNILIEHIDEKNIDLDESLIDAIEEALSTKKLEENKTRGVKGQATAEFGLKAKFASILRGSASVSASMSAGSELSRELRREYEPKMKEILDALNVLIRDVERQQGKEVVLIIDGLEKYRQESVLKLFTEDINAIVGIGAHLVMACPIAVLRSSGAYNLNIHFAPPTIMPMISTQNPDGTPNELGVSIVKDLVAKRTSIENFEDGVLEKIIAYAGGSLRDTCLLVSESAFAAFERNREAVDMESLKSVVNKLDYLYFLRIEEKYYETVKRIYKGDTEPRHNPDYFELMYAGTVLEYNHEKWVNLHPLVRRYIDNHPRCLGD